jgi:hypothetical protein
VEQFDDDRDRQGGGNPVCFLARPEVTLLGPRGARLRRFRAGFWSARPVIRSRCARAPGGPLRPSR